MSKVKVKVENLDKEVRLDVHVLQAKQGIGEEIATTQLIAGGGNYAFELDVGQTLKVNPMYEKAEDKPVEPVEEKPTEDKPEVEPHDKPSIFGGPSDKPSQMPPSRARGTRG